MLFGSEPADGQRGEEKRRGEEKWGGLMGAFADPGKEVGFFSSECWRVCVCYVFKFLKIEI